MRYISIIISVLFALNLYSQKIKIYDKSDLQPISHVIVFNQNKIKTTESNSKGEADISVFSDNDSITFYHMTFLQITTTKKKLAENNFEIFMTDKIIRLDEVVFSANKTDEKKSDLPNKIDVIQARQIAFTNPQSSGDMLQQTGNIFVQQSQMGGSSPVLRGFEANRVLIVVDGVRMNNAIYRSGHLQNVITVDPNMLEKTEIIFGPGSVIYGSDAMGGVMHFVTRNPDFSYEEKENVKVNGFTRYSSANSEDAAGLTINIGFKKIAFLTNFSYKNLGDLKTGSKKNPFASADLNPQFGLSNYYSAWINGKDSMLTNTEPLVQKYSGYYQYDALQKISFKPDTSQLYTLNFQYSNSSDVPRYDRLTDMSGSKLKWAEWNYGPQTRFLGSFNASIKNNNILFNNLNIVLAYQNISEDRIQRRFNNMSKEHREETVDAYSASVDLLRQLTEKNELRYGIEEVFNKVGSIAFQENIITQKKTFDISSRYPDDGSTMNTAAVYAAHNWEINNKIIFSQGVRFSFISLNALYKDTMMRIMNFPFDKKIKQNNSALNWNLGLVYMPGNEWRFSFMASSGFRAPNVDDISKVNDSKGSDQMLIVPNPFLKPEYAYNLDLTVGKVIAKAVQIEATGFYTILQNAMITKPTTFNGQDSIIYNGYKCQILSSQNASNGYILGVQGNFLAQVTPEFSIKSNISYTYGRAMDTIPMDHIPPVFGMTSFRYEKEKIKSEIYFRYNGDKLKKDYSPSGEDNEQYATPSGMPAWFTVNFRIAYQANKNIQLQAGIENIADVRYRIFASGISAPGRNFIFSLRGNF